QLRRRNDEQREPGQRPAEAGRARGRRRSRHGGRYAAPAVPPRGEARIGSRPTLAELDQTGYSIAVPAPAPMLDPTWTPAKGYSHAADLIAILNQHDLAKERAQNG